MFPISDQNPTLRTPAVNYALLGSIGFVWLFFQGAGLNPVALAKSVCNYGMVAGELTGLAKVGEGVPIGRGLACLVDDSDLNALTPITSMFLHGGWGHLLGNGLFLYVFGDNVEDSMGRLRYVVFYLACGLGAAAAQVAIDPDAVVPMVGASGAISGVLGGYLVLYPRVRVNILFIWIFIIQVLPLPAYVVLFWWIGYQLLFGLPQLAGGDVSGGVAFWAHIGGFVAGAILIKLFAKKELVDEHRRLIKRMMLRGRL